MSEIRTDREGEQLELSSDLRVLVVDDSSTIRSLMIRALAALGLSKISQASDGGEAWDILREGENEFDVVVSDWHMPRVSGLELLRKVRGNQRLQRMPFLMVTTNDVLEDVGNALQEGVSSYVVKPFTPESVAEQLKRILK